MLCVIACWFACLFVCLFACVHFFLLFLNSALLFIICLWLCCGCVVLWYVEYGLTFPSLLSCLYDLEDDYEEPATAAGAAPGELNPLVDKSGSSSGTGDRVKDRTEEEEEEEEDEDVRAERVRVLSGAADGEVVRIQQLRKIYPANSRAGGLNLFTCFTNAFRRMARLLCGCFLPATTSTTAAPPAHDAVGAVKKYKVAVQSLSFGIPKGECFGFLGKLQTKLLFFILFVLFVLFVFCGIRCNVPFHTMNNEHTRTKPRHQRRRQDHHAVHSVRGVPADCRRSLHRRLQHPGRPNQHPAAHRLLPPVRRPARAAHRPGTPRAIWSHQGLRARRVRGHRARKAGTTRL
jgi:hypothetical protein